MTSSRQIAANRRNARSSTGPRTEAGKKRSGRNAKRLGLSLPVLAVPGLSRQVETLTAELAGDSASTALRHLASDIAEAQIDLDRVRQVRDAILTVALHKSVSSEPNERDPSSLSPVPDSLTHPTDAPAATQDSVAIISEPPCDLANALCETVHQLSAIHRYEQRALSRRKFAIRMFDAARQRQQQLPGAKNAGEGA